MKTMRLLQTARRGRGLSVILCLAFPWLTFAQPQLPGSIVGPPVRITSPANHAVFFAPVDIPIFAYVRLGGVTFTNVEFYAGTNDLGRGFDLGSAILPPTPIYANFLVPKTPTTRLGSVYCLVWTNAPAGAYALTAVANGYDSLNPLRPISLSRTSAPVNITILTSTTNTNPTDVVSIVATDPIAIAGTNSCVWPGMTNATPAWTNWPPPNWHSFTNWGPKDALFTVRRFGDASEAITVNYNIGGTASNGVDYAALPGYVTIPAGGAYALIPIVPIDTNKFPKTVILTLTPSTNTPPDYVVGFPPRAAALILHVWPRPLPFLLPDGSFHLNAPGPDGAWFCVEYSTDLVNWSSISTNQVFQGSIDFVDPDAPNNSMRFYRAAPQGGPPPQ
jgi:hypothetical protein